MIRPTSRRVIPTRGALSTFSSRVSLRRRLFLLARKRTPDRGEIHRSLLSRKTRSIDQKNRSICTAWTADRTSHPSTPRYGENDESFSSHAPAFPDATLTDAALSKNIFGENFRASRVHLSRLHLEVGEASAPGRATPLGARRGRDRAKANSTHA